MAKPLWESVCIVLKLETKITVDHSLVQIIDIWWLSRWTACKEQNRTSQTKYRESIWRLNIKTCQHEDNKSLLPVNKLGRRVFAIQNLLSDTTHTDLVLCNNLDLGLLSAVSDLWTQWEHIHRLFDKLGILLLAFALIDKLGFCSFQ